MTKRKTSSNTYERVTQPDGTTQFVGSPCNDTRVKQLVHNLNKAWELGGARSVTRDTFEPHVLQQAFKMIERTADAGEWRRLMQQYLCVRLCAFY